jgi:hypothetical protein
MQNYTELRRITPNYAELRRITPNYTELRRIKQLIHIFNFRLI